MITRKELAAPGSPMIGRKELAVPGSPKLARKELAAGRPLGLVALSGGSPRNAPSERPPPKHRPKMLLSVGLICVAAVLLERWTPISPPSADGEAAIDLGDTAWMLVSTMAVFLMVPALGS